MPSPARAAIAISGTICGLALSAAGAQAAVVSVVRKDIPPFVDNNPKAPSSSPGSTEYTLTFEAAPGESNVVVMERAADALVVRDAVALTPGAGCVAESPTSVRCATPRGSGLALLKQAVGAVSLGDGNDRFQGFPAPDASGIVYPSDLGNVDGGEGDDLVQRATRAVGGAGNDRLEATGTADGGPGDDQIVATGGDGGDGNDTLTPSRPDVATRFAGGAGDDVLTGSETPAIAAEGDVLDGGDGADRLLARGGNDWMAPGAGADVIAGGAGADTVSLTYATAPVRLDLAAAGALDPTGEGDAMTEVEAVEGGSGNDELLGNDVANYLSGGAGDDRVDGRGGSDIIDGGTGDDALAGGKARDVIVGGAGADVVDGGEGDDDLGASGAVDKILGRPEVIPRRYVYAPDDSADRVSGGSGTDHLHVGTGDRGDAGAGDLDLLEADGRPAALSCGSGSRDKFKGAVAAPRDCERVPVFDRYLSSRLRLRNGVVGVRVPSLLEIDGFTRLTLTLRVNGKILARTRARIPKATSRTVRLRIAPRHRGLLRRAPSVRLEFVVEDATDDQRQSVRLLPPR